MSRIKKFWSCEHATEGPPRTPKEGKREEAATPLRNRSAASQLAAVPRGGRKVLCFQGGGGEVRLRPN